MVTARLRQRICYLLQKTHEPLVRVQPSSLDRAAGRGVFAAAAANEVIPAAEVSIRTLPLFE